MNMVLSLALLAIGIVLLVFGVSAADSIGSEFSKFFTGNPTDKSVWLILGGVVLIALGGGSMIFFRGRPGSSQV